MASRNQQGIKRTTEEKFSPRCYPLKLQLDRNIHKAQGTFPDDRDGACREGHNRVQSMSKHRTRTRDRHKCREPFPDLGERRSQ